MVKLTPRLLRFAAAFSAAAGLPDTPAPIRAPRLHSANYAQSDATKKSQLAHFPTSIERKTADCQPIDTAWVRFAPAAIDEWRAFTAKTNPKKAPISCAAARL